MALFDNTTKHNLDWAELTSQELVQFSASSIADHNSFNKRFASFFHRNLDGNGDGSGSDPLGPAAFLQYGNWEGDGWGLGTFHGDTEGSNEYQEGTELETTLTSPQLEEQL